jgi:hypothetical protein
MISIRPATAFPKFKDTPKIERLRAPMKKRDDVGPIKSSKAIWPAFNKTDSELAHLQETLQRAIGEVVNLRCYRLVRLREELERGFEELEERQDA